MKDFRISDSETATAQGQGGLVGVLVQRADEIARRFEELTQRIPYRSTTPPLRVDATADLVRAIAGATWKRLNEAVPGYGFAEELGRSYRQEGTELGALLLHWHLLRRAIHLALADGRFRTGVGDADALRQLSIMNYVLDWSAEAAIVGFVLVEGPVGGA